MCAAVVHNTEESSYDKLPSYFLNNHYCSYVVCCLNSAQVGHMLTRDHTVLPATHRWNESYLPLLPVAEHHWSLADTHFPSSWGYRVSWYSSNPVFHFWSICPRKSKSEIGRVVPSARCVEMTSRECRALHCARFVCWRSWTTRTLWGESVPSWRPLSSSVLSVLSW